MQSMTLWGRAAIMLAALLFLPGFARTVAARAAADQPTSPPEVLIYYANETSPDAVELRSWETILDWLRRSERPEAAKIVGQLECDAKEFPAAVDRELAAFRERLPGFRTGTSAVVFTNRLVRDGKYLPAPSGRDGV